MILRSPRERFIQTLSYEIGGWLLAVPFYVLVTNGSTLEGGLLMAAMAAAVMIWSPLHNTVFDWVDFKISGRLASDRPHRWRMLHAMSHELSTMVVTLPILILLGGFGFWPAVAVDLGLTLVYTVYAYGFHLAYDWLRPMGRRYPGLIAS
jgi:uncharacterized membrane protein